SRHHVAWSKLSIYCTHPLFRKDVHGNVPATSSPCSGRWYGGIFPARDEQQFPVCSWDVYRAYRIIHRHLQHRISWRLFYPNTCDDPNWLSICRENNEKLPRYYRLSIRCKYRMEGSFIMDSFITITLLRHGVTKENLSKKYLGWSDPPITEQAYKELIILQNQLPLYDFYMSSDLIRCKQTAEVVVPDTPGLETEHLREIHFGDWELKTYDELCHDASYRNWIDDPFNEQPPGGESFPVFKKRVMKAWKQLLEQMEIQHSKRVLVVTHGGVIRLLLTELTQANRYFWEWQIPHGQGMTLTWSIKEWREASTCTSLQAAPLTEKRHG